MKVPVAVTGASGFVGRAVVRRLVETGWPVRVLVRRCAPDLERACVVAVQGSLEDEAALQRLVAGAGAVVHCAGLVAAPSAAAFSQVNVVGSARLFAAAAGAATRPRILLLSSLAAREPRLSAYAHSKRAAEETLWQVADQGIEACALRPPAVYGPGDQATLPIFRQLRDGLLFVPAVTGARFSLLYVHDLADAVAHLLATATWPAFRSRNRRRAGRWLSLGGSGRNCRTTARSPGAHDRPASIGLVAGRGDRWAGWCGAGSRTSTVSGQATRAVPWRLGGAPLARVALARLDAAHDL